MITQALQETTAPAFDWVARELVFADESARPLLLDAFSRHRNDSHRKLVKALEEAWHAVSWPSGEAYLRSLGWLPKGERGAYEGKRRRVLEWAAANVGTGYVKGMSELGLRRTYGYALATLENCRAEEDRRARLNDSYRKRSNGR